jgi:hypothetical protein
LGVNGPLIGNTWTAIWKAWKGGPFLLVDAALAAALLQRRPSSDLTNVLALRFAGWLLDQPAFEANHAPVVGVANHTEQLVVAG